MSRPYGGGVACRHSSRPRPAGVRRDDRGRERDDGVRRRVSATDLRRRTSDFVVSAPRRVILTLLPADMRLQRLRAAARDAQRVHAFGSWSELTAACDRDDADAVVFDLYADGVPDFERVRQLRARAPRAPMVAYVEASRVRPRDAFDAGRCGLEAFVVAGEDDGPAALAAILDRATGRNTATLVGDALAGARPLVRDAVLLVDHARARAPDARRARAARRVVAARAHATARRRGAPAAASSALLGAARRRGAAARARRPQRRQRRSRPRLSVAERVPERGTAVPRRDAAGDARPRRRRVGRDAIARAAREPG